MKVVVTQYEGVTTMRPLPLAAGLLVATARASPALSGVTFRVDTRRRPIAEASARLAAHDVAGASLYTWNVRYSLAALAAAKALRPALVTVVGGPSVPRAWDGLTRFFVEHPAVDVAVIGEGELAFRAILEALAAPRAEDLAEGLAQIPGVVLRRGPYLVKGPERTRLAGSSFEATASPYLDGTFESLIIEGTEVDLPLVSAVFETNRGCPFSCSFCDWGQATESRVLELPRERVEAELRWAAERGVPYVYLVDANFGIRPRDEDLVRHLGALKRELGHPSFVYFHLTKNARRRNLRTVELLQDAGIGSQVSLSMQDLDEDVLAAIARDNIHPEDALALRAACHERGLPTTNELLLGLPRQTLASVRRTVTAALTPFAGDSFFLYPVRLLPNAPLAHQAASLGLETRQVPLLPRDLAEHHPEPEVEALVVASPTLPPEDWRAAFVFGHTLAALHDQRLLPASLSYAIFGAGRDPAALIDAILAEVPALAATLGRFADAILDELGTMLPVEGFGPFRWEPIEAACAAVLASPEAFFEGVARALHATGPLSPALADALAYDRRVFPWPPRPGAGLEVFTLGWDWVSPRDARVPPREGPLEAWLAPAPPFSDEASRLRWFLAAGWARAPRRAVGLADIDGEGG